MQPRAVGERRVDERGTEVDAATGALQHPLDEIAHLGIGQDDLRALGHPVACDEDRVWRVDPDLLDLGVVEVGLQRPKPRERRDELARGLGLVGEKGHGAAECPLAVPAHLVVNVPCRELRVGAQICAVASHPLPNLVRDLGKGVGHLPIIRDTGQRRRRLSTGARQSGYAWPSRARRTATSRPMVTRP